MYRVETLNAVIRECGARYDVLIQEGVVPDVAIDRVFDCYDSLFVENKHCFDTRDSLFENRLRDIVRENGE